MLLATASVAQLAEHRTRFAGPRVRFPAYVAFSQQVPVRSLKSRIMGTRYFLHQFVNLYIYIYICIYIWWIDVGWMTKRFRSIHHTNSQLFLSSSGSTETINGHSVARPRESGGLIWTKLQFFLKSIWISVCLQFCPKTFKRKDHMKSHQVIHSSKKPYCCDSCGKGFNQKVSLKRHRPCSNPTKSIETKAIGNGTEYCGETTLGNEIVQTSVANEISENKKNSKKFTSIDRTNKDDGNTVREYLRCRCPARCACKKFTIAVNVDCEDSRNSRSDFREVATLPCCCDIDIGKTIVGKTNGQ